jgi:hypothetical protein
MVSQRALLWLGDTANSYQNAVLIESGRQASLLAFAKYREEETFFIANERASDGGLVRSAFKFADTHKSFDLELRDRIDRTYRFRIFADQDPFGVNANYRPYISDRIDEALGGFRQVKNAIFGNWR